MLNPTHGVPRTGSTKGFSNSEQSVSREITRLSPRQFSGKAQAGAQSQLGTAGLNPCSSPGKGQGITNKHPGPGLQQGGSILLLSRQAGNAPTNTCSTNSCLLALLALLAQHCSGTHLLTSCQLTAGSGPWAAGPPHCLSTQKCREGRGKHGACICLTPQTYLSHAEGGTAVPFPSSSRYPSSWEVISSPL